jgi:hypothetical protein
LLPLRSARSLSILRRPEVNAVPRERVLCDPAPAMRFFSNRHIWLRRIAAIAAVLFSAFVVVSAVMFWVPFFGVKTGWYDIGSGYFSPDASNSLGYGYTDYSADLKKLSPIEERPLLDAISDDLKQKTNAELFQLKAYEDICVIDVIDCRGLTAAKSNRLSMRSCQVAKALRLRFPPARLTI